MHRALRVVAVVVSLAVAAATPASAGIPSGRYAIGDSVMLGARDELRARGFRVNALVSRQFNDALPLVRKLKRAGSLRRTIVIHLGTNGILVDPERCDAIARTVGRDRRLFLVTIKIGRRFRRTQNARLRACADRHRNTRLIDWYGYSHDHPSWFADDGYHLTPTGRVRYASLLARATS